MTNISVQFSLPGACIDWLHFCLKLIHLKVEFVNAVRQPLSHLLLLSLCWVHLCRQAKTWVSGMYTHTHTHTHTYTHTHTHTHTHIREKGRSIILWWCQHEHVISIANNARYPRNQTAFHSHKQEAFCYLPFSPSCPLSEVHIKNLHVQYLTCTMCTTDVRVQV